MKNGLALSDLGRRLERLFYFGSLLLLICFLQLYFVNATIFSKEARPEEIAEIISLLEKNIDDLKSLYDQSISSTNKRTISKDGQQYMNARRYLGLPLPSSETGPKESYGDALARILGSTRSASKRLAGC